MFHFGIFTSSIPYIVIGAVYFVYMMSFAIGKYCNTEDICQEKATAQSVYVDEFSFSMDFPQNYMASSDEFIASEKHDIKIYSSFVAPVINYKATHLKVPLQCANPSLFPNPPPVFSLG